MKFSFKWLQSFFSDSAKDKFENPVDLAERLSASGLEVESLISEGAGIESVVVAQILKKDKHPDADKLNLCEVQVGAEKFSIVCGAQNMSVGDKVALAQVGASLPGGMKIKKSKIRGVESSGMLCSAAELGLDSLKEGQEGILILDANLETGQSIQSALNLDDTIFEINVTPNRGDCLSIQGVINEVQALYKIKANFSNNFEIQESKDLETLTIQNKVSDLCRRYACRRISSVRVAESPQYIQDLLKKSGIRPINNLVDLSNLLMIETGHPCHIFDFDRLTGKEIYIRRAEVGEKIKTLDEQDLELSNSGLAKDDVAQDLVIADASGPIALAGVMGALDSGVTEQTQNILLEVASFDPVSIRRTAKRHALHSESSYRFERDVDPNGVLQAMDRLTQLIIKDQTVGDQEIRISQVKDDYPQILETQKIKFRVQRCADLLGISIQESECEQIFDLLGFSVSSLDGDFLVEVPTRRPDLSREIDLVEEVARIRGLDQIEATYPTITLNQLKKPKKSLSQNLAQYLIDQGFNEVINYSFIDQNSAAKYAIQQEDLLRLDNPMSEEMAYLRNNLMASLIKTAQHNLARSQTDLSLFEMRSVFDSQGQERLSLALFCAGKRENAHFSGEASGADFYYLKGLIQAWFARESLGALQEKTSKISYLHPKRAIDWTFRGKALGYLGQLHPQRVKEEDLPAKTIICEISLDELDLCKRTGVNYQAFSQFPAVWRDLNLIVEDSVSHAQVEKAIRSLKPKLLIGTELVDVYSGDSIGATQKALTYRFEYHAKDRTLTDAEVNVEHEKIMHALLDRLEAKLKQ